MSATSITKGIIYVQATGEVALQNGDFELPFAVGAAGAGEGRNNPSQDHVRNVGPLPRGRYRISVVEHPRFKPPALRLDPEADTEMHGRSGFWVHGGTKSEGCILLPYETRRFISAGLALGFATLTVVER